MFGDDLKVILRRDIDGVGHGLIDDLATLRRIQQAYLATGEFVQVA